MTARQRRFWWAAAVITVLLGGPSLAYIVSTDSASGRRFLLGVVEKQTNAIFKGRATLKIGSLREIGATHVTATDVSLLDSAGAVVVHVDSLDATIAVGRLLFDKAIRLRTLSIRGFTLNVQQDVGHPFNISYILVGDPTVKSSGPPGYGSNIQIDALTISDAAITTVIPWAPNRVFVGAARDSVTAVRDSLHDLIRTPTGLFERRRILLDRVVARDGIITQPDKKPSSMLLDTLRGTISDPPVRLVDLRGRLEWTPDSMHLDLPEVKLPASTGSAVGTVAWNNPGPVRYDVLMKVQAGLSDLRWIWDVLPESGTGTSTIRMRTLENPENAEYTLSPLDVQTMDSRVTGSISVVTKPADLLLHNVDLAFVPLQSTLARRLSYGVLPDTVRGTFEGRLKAVAGGSLRAFAIDTLNMRFTDARIPGAVSSVTMGGVVALGAAATARDLTVSQLFVDLRSVAQFSPTAPKLDGTLSGRAHVIAASLQSASLEQLALVWKDAKGNTSALRGDLRVGFGGGSSPIETDLTLDAISMRALARLDTTLTMRADIAGTVRTTGSMESLGWSARVGPIGGGLVDLRGTASLIGDAWRVAAAGTVASINARVWSGSDSIPITSFSGDVSGNATGTRSKDGVLSLALAGGAVALAQPAATNQAAADLTAKASLDAQRLRVDSAIAHIAGIAIDVRGALARDASGIDTLIVSARADSLDRVRAELSGVAKLVESADSTSAASIRSVAADTLRGNALLSGYVVGSIKDMGVTVAVSANDAQFGALHLGRVFGSLNAEHLRTVPTFSGAATVDAIDGIGTVRIASAELKVQQATPDSGRLVLDVSSPNDARLGATGRFTRADGRTDVTLDSLHFRYDSVSWRNATPLHGYSDKNGIRIDSLVVQSNTRGVLGVVADLPLAGPIRAALQLNEFPLGKATTFAVGVEPFNGTMTGNVQLSGTRASPLLKFAMDIDSLGRDGTVLPKISTDGDYADRKLVAHANVVDAQDGSLRLEARVPIDLSIGAVEKRVLSDQVDAEVVANALRLDALGFAIDGVSKTQGVLAGRLALTGTMDRPVATGTMTLDKFSATVATLGVAPSEGRIQIRAAQDSLIIESLRVRSGGPSDTLSATGAMRFAAKEPATIRVQIAANNFELARQRDGNDLDLSGRVELVGPLKRPELSGAIIVPVANIVYDPLSASKALDLTSASARELLGADEVPVAASAAQSFSELGRFVSVANARVDLGDEVWVQTPQARVKISGGLAVTMNGDNLALEGEITANRGQYRLDLGVVNRSFAVDSGSVRFFGTTAIAPTLDISATNVVRLATGGEIPVRVHIGGTLDRPAVTLSSSDPLFASAPESEIISLLIFGAPTFALDGQSQNTVKAVTGVLLPTAGGAVEGVLQRLLPVFNTVQVNTAGGQTKDDLNLFSLLDNLSITAGKQLGSRTFLRVNTGVCRGTGQSASLWYGIAAEFRMTKELSAQVGVDPGSAPCTRLGGDLLPRLQFGFDLFREWIF